MRLPTYFKRRKGASPASLAAIGSDSAPTFATDGKIQGDNVLSHKFTRPFDRIAIGYWYEGGGSAVTLPVTIYVFDESSSRWYEAATGTLTNGKLTFLRCPCPCDPPPTQANMSKPSHGVDVLIVVADNTSPDGILHFAAGPDAARF